MLLEDRILYAKALGNALMKSGLIRIAEDQLQRADRLIWGAIAGTAIVVFAASLIGPFQIDWASFLKAGLACSLLIAAGWFYRTVRKDPLPAAALTSTVQIITFAMAAAPLSYIAASAALPCGTPPSWHGTFISGSTGWRCWPS